MAPKRHAPERAAHGARADEIMAVLHMGLAVRVAHDLRGVGQLDDHVLLELRQRQAELVSLSLVLEAQNDQFMSLSRNGPPEEGPPTANVWPQTPAEIGTCGK